MKLKYSNRTGLISLFGVVAGLLLIAVTYPLSIWLAAFFGLVAVGFFVIFSLYLYHFIFDSQAVDLPEEDSDSKDE